MSDSPALIDIVEPAAPVVAQSAHGWLYALLVLGVLFIAAGIFVWRKRRGPAQQALQQLRTLQQKLHSGEHTPHEVVLLFALEVRHGLGVKRMRADQPPAHLHEQDHARWSDFMGELDAMLYQHDSELQQEQVSAFFVQGEYWLKRYARRSTLRKMEV